MDPRSAEADAGHEDAEFYSRSKQSDGPPDVLDGDDEQQMRALRDYVISLGLPPAPVAEAHAPRRDGATRVNSQLDATKED